MEARKTLLLQNNDLLVFLCEQCSNRRAGGAATYNEHITFTVLCHRRCQLGPGIARPGRIRTLQAHRLFDHSNVNPVWCPKIKAVLWCLFSVQP
jgi:hypothetical protein